MFKYKANIKKEDQEFIVTFPDLPGCFSIGSTFEEAALNAKEALDLYLEEANDPYWPLPKSKNYSGADFFWITPSYEIAIPLMIREARKCRKLTQQQAADLLQIKIQTYQKLEYLGKSNPTALTLLKIAEAFKTSFKLSA